MVDSLRQGAVFVSPSTGARFELRHDFPLGGTSLGVVHGARPLQLHGPARETTESVCLKISRGVGCGRWHQEVRLLRRVSSSTYPHGGRGHLLEYIEEFAGDDRLPGVRLLVTAPECWGSLERRIKVSSIQSPPPIPM